MRAFRPLSYLLILALYSPSYAGTDTAAAELTLAQLQAAFELNAASFKKIANEAVQSGCFSERQMADVVAKISSFEESVRAAVNTNITSTIAKTTEAMGGEGKTREAFRNVEAGAADREEYLAEARKKLFKAQLAQNGVIASLKKIQSYHSKSFNCGLLTLSELDQLDTLSTSLLSGISSIDAYYKKTETRLAAYRLQNKTIGERVENTESEGSMAKNTQAAGGKKFVGKKQNNKGSNITGFDEAARKDAAGQKILNQQP